MMPNLFFEFRGWFYSKEFKNSVTQGARGAGAGAGFQYTPSQSLVDAYEPNDVRAATIILQGQHYMMGE
jgi:hypothetical protein